MTRNNRTSVVAGNWKMNGSASSITELLGGVKKGLSEIGPAHCEVLVFPAFAYLDIVVRQTLDSGIKVGAQDVDVRSEGAVTGGVSAMMAQDVGAAYAIIGHSERRTLFAESDETVAAKFEQCRLAGLVPVVCVGESLEERQQGKTLEVVTRQLGAVTGQVGPEQFVGALVAYEPVWAIGTGESATPEQAEEVHGALRGFLADWDESLGQSTRILYGGSVTPENAATLFEKDNVDGGLVGGASLKAKSFVEICKAAEESYANN